MSFCNYFYTRNLFPIFFSYFLCSLDCARNAKKRMGSGIKETKAQVNTRTDRGLLSVNNKGSFAKWSSQRVTE
jgi:hypothetical protein